MGMTTPVDPRVRNAIVRGYHKDRRTYDELAGSLGVGLATVNRVLRLHRETGGVAPRPRGGGNFSPIEGKLTDLLCRIVADMPDATVAELTAALMKRGSIYTSRSSVQRALARLGYSRKKSHSWQRSATRRSTE